MVSMVRKKPVMPKLNAPSRRKAMVFQGRAGCGSKFAIWKFAREDVPANRSGNLATGLGYVEVEEGPILFYSMVFDLCHR